ncbi:MAG: RsmE family RNA methyltransferase, partial [Patescibacteria group bacterium]|nr:RsmE family RNA methyltransferase [Patescibacteria group bacterium]
MTIHRFFVTPIQFDVDAITLVGDTAWQISKVLRLMPGDIICVFDGSGKEYRVMLEKVDKKEVTGHKVFEFVNNTEPIVRVTLYHALLPRDTFEHVLQKGTEIGVSTFVPVEAERSIVRIKDV